MRLFDCMHKKQLIPMLRINSDLRIASSAKSRIMKLIVSRPRPAHSAIICLICKAVANVNRHPRKKVALPVKIREIKMQRVAHRWMRFRQKEIIVMFKASRGLESRSPDSIKLLESVWMTCTQASASFSEERTYMASTSFKSKVTTTNVSLLHRRSYCRS